MNGTIASYKAISARGNILCPSKWIDYKILNGNNVGLVEVR